jgi:type IV pilus assembly protein PilM
MSQAIGIDIGSHAVKVAVLQRKGGATKAVRLFRAPIAGDTDPARAQGALNRSGISGGPGLISISGRDLIIRYTHVPPVPDWRLKLLMQFEINEVSGQSGGEVAADYARLNLPVDGDEDTVLVALARNTWLGPRLAAVRGAGMKAGGGCPASVALFNAFVTHGNWNDGETTFLVNIGRENIDMAIARDGELLFARNMSGGGHMFTEAIMGTFGLREPKAEKNKVTKGDLTPRGQARYADATAEKLANAMQGPAGQLVSMIQSSVMICRAQTKIADLNIDRLVLTGGTASMKGIQKYFAANMSVPVEIFDPANELDQSGLNAEDAAELGDVPTDFAVAIGLAETLISPSAFRLEVLTEKEKKKRNFSERTVYALAAAAALLLLIVLLFNTRSAAIDDIVEANEKLKFIKNKNRKTKEWQDRAQAEEREARMKALAIRSRRYPLAFQRAILGAVFANHSANIYLRRYSMETKKVSLKPDGAPAEGRGALGGDDPASQGNLHAQNVWPQCEIVGVVQKEFTDNPGKTLNSYYTGVRAAVNKIAFPGMKVVMNETGLGPNNEFTMKFTIAPAKPEGDKEGN